MSTKVYTCSTCGKKIITIPYVDGRAGDEGSKDDLNDYNSSVGPLDQAAAVVYLMEGCATVSDPQLECCGNIMQ